jgi:hypothetical protein
VTELNHQLVIPFLDMEASTSPNRPLVLVVDDEYLVRMTVVDQLDRVAPVGSSQVRTTNLLKAANP